MTFADLQTAAERDVWLAELKAMAGSPRAEFWSAHAVTRHRQCHSGPMEIAKARRRSTKAAKGATISDSELTALTDRCKAEALIAVPALPPGGSGRQRQFQRTRVGAFVALSMQMLVGTTLAARAMGITEQAVRDRSWCLRRGHRDITEKAEVFVTVVHGERKQDSLSKEKAA